MKIPNPDACGDFLLKGSSKDGGKMDDQVARNRRTANLPSNEAAQSICISKDLMLLWYCAHTVPYRIHL